MRTKMTVKLCFLISLAMGIFAALLRTVALLVNYSPESGHFTKGDVGILPELGWGICFAGLAAVALLCFMRRKGLAEYEEKGGLLYTTGAILFVCAVFTAVFESLSAYLKGDPAAKTVNLIIAIGAFLSCIIIFVNTFFPIKGVDPRRAGISIIPAIFIVLPGYRLYFDPSLVMNCPNKNVYIIASCLAAMMLIYECRFHTELRNTAIYVTACCGTLIFGLFCGIPNLIYAAANGGSSVVHSIATDVLSIGVAVFAAVQLVSVHRNRKKS